VAADDARVDHRIRIEAPPSRVWRALTDEADVRRWLFASAQVEPRVGGVWQFTFPHWPSARGLLHPSLGFVARIMAFEPERLLAVRFEPPYWGELRFELAAVGDAATALHVTQDGFAGHEEWLGDFRGGWGSFTDRLALLCETGSVARVSPADDALCLPVSGTEAAAGAVAALERSLPRRGWSATGPAETVRTGEGAEVRLPFRPRIDRETREPFVRAFERAFCAPGRAGAGAYFAPHGGIYLAGPPYPRPNPQALDRLPAAAVVRFRGLQVDGETLRADWEGSGWTAGRNRGTSEWTFASCGRIERLVLHAPRGGVRPLGIPC
jgi:uncharacterized protein YndB with AHSA1/START domain